MIDLDDYEGLHDKYIIIWKTDSLNHEVIYDEVSKYLLVEMIKDGLIYKVNEIRVRRKSLSTKETIKINSLIQKYKAYPLMKKYDDISREFYFT